MEKPDIPLYLAELLQYFISISFLFSFEVGPNDHTVSVL